MLERVLINIILWRPRASINELPPSKSQCSVSCCRNEAEGKLLRELGPELRKLKDFPEEDVELLTRLRPLVEVV